MHQDAHDSVRLREKLEEVFWLEPNDLHFRPLTRIYKSLTKRLKAMPFIYIIPLAFALAAVMYLVLGPLLIKLVTLLQYGS